MGNTQVARTTYSEPVLIFMEHYIRITHALISPNFYIFDFLKSNQSISSIKKVGKVTLKEGMGVLHKMIGKRCFSQTIHLKKLTYHTKRNKCLFEFLHY